jgi:hypothetical protein
LPVATVMEMPMDENNDPRIDLADRKIELFVAGMSLLAAIIELISKVVNYASPFSELRVRLQT